MKWLVIFSLMMTLAPLSFAQTPQIGQDEHVCQQNVEKLALSFAKDLNSDKMSDLDYKVEEAKFIFSLESYPTQEAFRVKISSNLPSHVEIELLLSGDNCSLIYAEPIQEK